MRRSFYFILIVSAFITLIRFQPLQAQAMTESIENRNQLTAGVGFLGLLYLDEFRQETLFTRKALPPIFVQYDRQLWQRFSVGVYFGMEYEMQSGTIKDFDGPTTSIVSGLLADYHFIRLIKRKYFDPYIGLSFYYYDSSGLDNTVLPGLRLGCNIKVYKNFRIRLNTGAGASLIESGIVFNY